LDGLTQLTPTQAKILASFDGDGYLSSLSLNGLTELTDSIASALGGCKATDLYLDGLTSMTDEQARQLGKYDGYLLLRRLSSITDNQAMILGCSALEFPYLDSITPRQIRLLGSYALPGRPRRLHLDLSGLTHLTDEQIDALLELGNCDDKGRPIRIGDRYSGRQNSISLDGVDSLTEAQMKRLAEFGGDIRLGLNGRSLMRFRDYQSEFWDKRREEARDTIEAAFAACAPCQDCGFAMSLTSLTGNEARILVNCCPPLSDKFTYLYFNSLRCLEDSAAAALANWQGSGLKFDNLSVLSPAAARSLAQFKGDYLTINGLTSISDSLLCALSDYDGILSFDSLKTLDGLSRDCFGQLKTVDLWLRSVRSMSDEEATNLLCAGGDYGVWFAELCSITDLQLDLILASTAHYADIGLIDSITEGQIRKIAQIRHFFTHFATMNISQEMGDSLISYWKEIHGTTDADIPSWWSYGRTNQSPCK
jgi:hypothetical protein